MRPQARVDLLEIWHRIAANNISSAHRVIEEIEAAVDGLVVMPGKGHTRTDVDDPRFRFWPVKPYVIAYRYDSSTVIVERVVHGHRDFRKLFGQ